MNEIEELVRIVETALDSIPKLNSAEHRKRIIDLFKQNKWSVRQWPPKDVKKKEFITMIKETLEDKSKTAAASRLYKRIQEKVSSGNEEEKEEERPLLHQSSIGKQDDENYQGYQEFQVWCLSWRNIQHRLRYLTFVVCNLFNRCTTTVFDVRIGCKADQLPQFEIDSFVYEPRLLLISFLFVVTHTHFHCTVAIDF